MEPLSPEFQIIFSLFYLFRINCFHTQINIQDHQLKGKWLDIDKQI